MKKISWYQVNFVNNESMDRKTSDNKSALLYYSMLYQLHMWKIDYNLQHQDFSSSHPFFDISIVTVTNVYIKPIEFFFSDKLSYYVNSS